MIPLNNRGKFLFLARSPLFAKVYAQETGKLAIPKDVLSAMDLEKIAHRALPPAHWGYMSSGVDDNFTLQANTGPSLDQRDSAIVSDVAKRGSVEMRSGLPQ